MVWMEWMVGGMSVEAIYEFGDRKMETKMDENEVNVCKVFEVGVQVLVGCVGVVSVMSVMCHADQEHRRVMRAGIRTPDMECAMLKLS